MIDAVGMRLIIIGNSGSGKSTLAQQIAARAGCRAVDLDTVYWENQVLLKKRVQPAAIAMAAECAQRPAWVIEGVYGWLIDVAVPRATGLIWLDLPWAECRAGLEARRPFEQTSAAELDDRMAWAEQYWTRTTPSSHAGHGTIFEAFAGDKRALTSRADVAAFVSTFPLPGDDHGRSKSPAQLR
jgi:hypothetical protein